jgi:hypothetical protein
VRVYPGRSRPTHESATQKKRRSEKSADTIVEASTALQSEAKDAESGLEKFP